MISIRPFFVSGQEITKVRLPISRLKICPAGFGRSPRANPVFMPC
jgi:hypothetical protein